MANKPKNNNKPNTDKKASDTRTQARKMAAAQGKKRESTLDYWKGVRQEMKKVVWPTRKELGSFTAVVLATCAAFALLFWGVDSGVLAAIRAICF